MTLGYLPVKELEEHCVRLINLAVAPFLPPVYTTFSFRLFFGLRKGLAGIYVLVDSFLHGRTGCALSSPPPSETILVNVYCYSYVLEHRRPDIHQFSFRPHYFFFFFVGTSTAHPHGRSFPFVLVVLSLSRFPRGRLGTINALILIPFTSPWGPAICVFQAAGSLPRTLFTRSWGIWCPPICFACQRPLGLLISFSLLFLMVFYSPPFWSC